VEARKAERPENLKARKPTAHPQRHDENTANIRKWAFLEKFFLCN
jgi:hypothetical protein